jgi:hypothetical protein
LDITEHYTTASGSTYLIRLSYNERIGERDPADAFVLGLVVRDAATNTDVQVDAPTKRFSTFENFSTFGSYAAINYQGTRAAAIEGLRTKILTRVEDALEKMQPV